MAEIVSMTIRRHENNFTFGVVKNDNYIEVTTEDTESVRPLIKELLVFANSVMTEEEKQIRELERKQNDILKTVIKNTTDDEKLEMIDIFPQWDSKNKFVSGEYVQYREKLYEVLQGHTRQPDWSPDIALSLFAEVVRHGDLLEWRQPINAETAYQTNDRVVFEGAIWLSLINDNTWSPKDYPQGWQKEREL